MSEQNKHHRNKPEKLELTELPKLEVNEQAKRRNVKNLELPFHIQLQQIKSNAEKQAIEQLLFYKENFKKNIETSRKSKVIIYYSISYLEDKDFEIIFDFVSSLGKQKKMDLYILSPGGFANPAYKIARLFQNYSEEKFSVLVPYYAKSAATILSLGADEIVMGPASELGPIDPQFKVTSSASIPALALKEALDYITKEIQKNPSIAPLYIPLLDKVNLIELGHFEREIESAKQYVEKLLTSRKIDKLNESGAKKIADKLAKEYKTHNFAIDGQAASQLLGNTVKILDANDSVWKCMWRLHNIYDQYIKDQKAIKIIETLNESYVIGNKPK